MAGDFPGIALLAATDPRSEQAVPPANTFGLTEFIRFDDVYFDSTCIKADIHFPIDWVLLRDAARTLMKATVHILFSSRRIKMPASLAVVK